MNNLKVPLAAPRVPEMNEVARAKYDEAIAKARIQPKGRKKKPLVKCACTPWCGEMTQSKWFPGHDIKFHARIMREERARLAQMQEVA